MSAYLRLLRPLLFRMNAETAHNLALKAITMGLVRARLLRDPRLEVSCLGLQFQNPLGLAAGFDKSAVAVTRWPSLGFGFAEIGTVTPRPQSGNPCPRLFRLPQDRAIINRMGFNNDGAVLVAEKLKQSQTRGHSFPIGINLGKQKETPNELAVNDYAEGFELLASSADYVVVNVSSPNTQGLRELQDASALREIVQRLSSLSPSRPVLVKLAPDLEDSALTQAIGVCVKGGASGAILTNTTLSRVGLTTKICEAGGLSGKPLKTRSDEALSLARSCSPNSFVLIGVGGVFTGADMAEKLLRGASLVQIYTGWIYRGPQAVPQILAEYLAELEMRN